MKKLNIAIDGYAGCGKSTLAKDLAKSLSYTFVDTGALYRGITYFLLEEDITLNDDTVQKYLATKDPKLFFEEDSNNLLLDGQDIEDAIRTRSEIADNVSTVAALPSVRSFLKNIQKVFVDQGGSVMEGRDIGTVVMPEADVKLFITASIDERVNRRYSQLKHSGHPISREEVEKNLVDRDERDAGRAVAPLRKAQDAIALDTSQFDQSEQLDVCMAMIRPYLEPEQYLRFIR